MIFRNSYIEQIKPFIDKPLIKVLTGIRRCGKSFLLMLLKEHLLKSGIGENQIIYINFESLENINLTNEIRLYNHIKERIEQDKQTYILLDEIQNVSSWERVTNSLLVDFNVDLYVTGSNSKLLSSELSTLISGRYIEIHLQTLVFKEYLEFKKINTQDLEANKLDIFKNYLRLGGFPVINIGDYLPETAYRIISDIYSSVILRDTVQRYNIRNIELLNRVVRFVFDNVGNIFSAKKISDYFKSQYRKIDINTIYNYLDALESAFIIQRVPRYNLHGKEILKTNEKYFVGDHSFIYATMGYNDRHISGILENIMLRELIFRGYTPYIGKLGNREIDFVALKNNQRIYIQVTYKLTDDATINREFKPLISIKDHYPKYVVSMDEFWQGNIEGVKHVHIADFLLQETW